MQQLRAQAPTSAWSWVATTTRRSPERSRAVRPLTMSPSRSTSPTCRASSQTQQPPPRPA